MDKQDVPRVISQETAGGCARLLGELQVSLGGLPPSAELHGALVNDGLCGRLTFLVAVEDGEVAGVLLAMKASYRWSFVLSHPILAARAVARRFSHSRDATPRTDPAIFGLCCEWEAPAKWGDSGILHTLFIGVSGQYQGNGIAKKLYSHISAPILARISLCNTASLHMHHGAGFRLFVDGPYALAVRS